jgi:uncharacterized protein HemY
LEESFQLEHALGDYCETFLHENAHELADFHVTTEQVRRSWRGAEARALIAMGRLALHRRQYARAGSFFHRSFAGARSAHKFAAVLGAASAAVGVNFLEVACRALTGTNVEKRMAK